MAEIIHAGEVVGNANGYGIIDCAECGFIHMDPVPEPSELERVYAEEYYRDEKPLFIERVIEDLDWWRSVYDERFDFLESRLGDGMRSILDIGSGPGYFLKRGMERGWSGLGIEPSRQAAAHAMTLGVEVINGFFNEETASGIKRRFDALHLSEVLEHVPQPEALLRTASGLLSKGGIICCVVPNDFSPVQKVLTDRLGFGRYWLAPPHHVNYFSFESLSTLLERSGFRVVGRTSMFPIDLFLLMGDNYVGNDQLGRECHARRKKLDLMLNEPVLAGFKKEMYELMARHGIGREMVIYGVKE
ncbi:MAG: class I SAM-dependent methyltransferase [Deltaproteobacteria bacterium]|nr:class I SAM-dependent methyltransferase [Deltaproteobacteria bacterium]MBZ0219240.1 class I SAM-dependent methyltransferase [Deltaproteobacteria bacterium]